MKRIVLILIIMLIGCGEKTDGFNSKNIITREELLESINNPTEDDKGKSTVFGAQVAYDVGQDKDRHYYVVMLDPENYDHMFIIDVPKEEGDYIIVEGVISGTFKGENMVGGPVTNLAVTSDNVEDSTYFDAIAPAIETIVINQTKSQNDLDITLEKIEISEVDTRLYVEVVNNSEDNVSIYPSDFTIVAGGKNYTEEYMFNDNYVDIDNKLAANTSTKGMIAYKPIAIESIEEFLIMVESPYSDNWDIDFEDFVLGVSK